MTKNTPNTKALLSAIIGLVAAALIVGAINFGPALGQSLQGEDLAASSQARESFVVTKSSSSPTTNVTARPAATTPLTASVVAANTTLAAVTGEPGDDTQYESEDD
jgi:hypothetical protein